MEFCGECGSIMKKIDGEWICSNCTPEKIDTAPSTREAVILTCPECKKQRAYCGIEGSLSHIKWKQGIDYHLKHHDLDEETKNEYYLTALEKREIKEIPEEKCEESDAKGWAHYNF